MAYDQVSGTDTHIPVSCYELNQHNAYGHHKAATREISPDCPGCSICRPIPIIDSFVAIQEVGGPLSASDWERIKKVADELKAWAKEHPVPDLVLPTPGDARGAPSGPSRE